MTIEYELPKDFLNLAGSKPIHFMEKIPSITAQRKANSDKESAGVSSTPPSFQLKASAIQRVEGDKTPGRGKCTDFGDYWIVPDDTKVCYVGVVGEQITESEFAKLEAAYTSIKDGSGQIVVSEKDDKGGDHAGFKTKTVGQLAKLMSKPLGRKLILALLAGGQKVTIQPTSSMKIASAKRGAGSEENADGTAGAGGTTTIQIDADLADDKVLAFDKAGKEIASPVFLILGHELIHAKHNQEGRNKRSQAPTDAAFGNKEEEETISTGTLTENGLRAEHGLGERHGHNGKVKP